jgi:hypothetical protein
LYLADVVCCAVVAQHKAFCLRLFFKCQHAADIVHPHLTIGAALSAVCAFSPQVLVFHAEAPLGWLQEELAGGSCSSGRCSRCRNQWW